MGRIEDIFTKLRAEESKALMPFLCGDFPEQGTTGELIRACERGGASIVEIGFPFSDPIADGPVIAHAMHDALAHGSTPRGLFEQIAAVRDQTALGLVAMVSVSIIHGLGGPEGFARDARQAGFDGLIVPDVPLEESGPLAEAALEHGLTLSLLVAQTTPADRACDIARACTGFVYLMAQTGLTGERDRSPRIARSVATIREATDLPIACGFGISSAPQVAAVVEHADAAIVGSALIRELRSADDPIAQAQRTVETLASGLGGVPSGASDENSQ